MIVRPSAQQLWSRPKSLRIRTKARWRDARSSARNGSGPSAHASPYETAMPIEPPANVVTVLREETAAGSDVASSRAPGARRSRVSAPDSHRSFSRRSSIATGVKYVRDVDPAEFRRRRGSSDISNPVRIRQDSRPRSRSRHHRRCSARLPIALSARGRTRSC